MYKIKEDEGKKLEDEIKTRKKNLHTLALVLCLHKPTK